MAKSSKASPSIVTRRQRSKGGTRGTIYQQVSIIRLGDAQVLLDEGRHLGAIYIAGYAVECRLKWAVTQRMAIDYLPPEFETHDLDQLLIAAGLEPALKKARQLHSVYSSIAEKWGPELRYMTTDPGAKNAKALYWEIQQVYSWITENTI